MKRFMLAVMALSGLAFAATPASAQQYGYQGGWGSQQYGQSGYGYNAVYGYRQSGPVYHPPSVHQDQVYHPTRTHWTPFRGFHTHGHYDSVPHYTPGHYDYQHRGHVHGKSDKTASAPIEHPVHPTELLATIYHSVGIKPETIVYNHLNQPRELVKGEVASGILA